jgi:hypothetical protein
VKIRSQRIFLQAGAMEDSRVQPTRKGAPQGGIVSPLIGNIVLNHLGGCLETQGYRFVRYADDFLVFRKSNRHAEKALETVTRIIEEDFGLSLSPEKTRIVTFGEAFGFLELCVSAFTIFMGGKSEKTLQGEDQGRYSTQSQPGLPDGRRSESCYPRHGALLQCVVHHRSGAFQCTGPIYSTAHPLHAVQTYLDDGQRLVLEQAHQPLRLYLLS